MSNRSSLTALTESQPVAVPYVMIVESDEELARMLQEVMKDEMRTETIFASTVKDALNVVCALCPIVFLINADLVEGDGIVLVDTLRNNRELATVPIILLTTEPRRDEQRAKERDIACLPLPFELTTLCSMMEKYLSTPIKSPN